MLYRIKTVDGTKKKVPLAGSTQKQTKTAIHKE
jgi:hypothetical protein